MLDIEKSIVEVKLRIVDKQLQLLRWAVLNDIIPKGGITDKTDISFYLMTVVIISQKGTFLKSSYLNILTTKVELEFSPL